MTPPPDRLLLDRGAVGRLNFQPRVCPAPMPCIASRVGDILTVTFVEPTYYGNNGNAPHDPASWKLAEHPRHRYQLAALSETVLTGTLITEGNEHNG